MVKRALTPPPAEDEPKYLTVVHPYPLCATMELFQDQKDFVRWLACCTGKDVLYAFFHKPSAHDMVILEVDRYFDGYDRLLGAHKWSEFLQSPTEEEKDQVTKIFYCTHDTGRKVQKNGWKRVEIQEHWFHGWSANNIRTTYPYPPSSYCEVPPENPTVGPLCRLLPVASFPPPPRVPAPPVGSAQWLQAKGGAASAAAQKQSKPASAAGAWAKGAPKSQSVVSGNGSAKGSKAPAAKNNGPARAPPSIAKSASDSPWTKTPPGLKSKAPSVVTSVATASSSSTNSSSVATPLSATMKSDYLPPPPGLSKPTASLPTQQKFIWSDDVEDDEASSVQFDLGSQARGGFGTGAANGRDSISGITQTTANLHLDDDDEDDSFLPSVHSVVPAAVNYDAIPKSTNVWGRRDGGIEDAYDPKLEADGPPIWDDYAAPREDKLLPWKENCPLHGALCKAGICKERMTAAAARRKEEERLQREKEKAERARRREKREKAGKGRGGDDADYPWDDEPSTVDGEGTEVGQDWGNQDEPSPWDTVDDVKSTAQGAHDDNDDKKAAAKSADADPWGTSAASNNRDTDPWGTTAKPSVSANADPWAGSSTPWGDDSRSTVSSVARAAPRNDWSNSPTPWDAPAAPPNVNSSPGWETAGKGNKGGKKGKGKGKSAWGSNASQAGSARGKGSISSSDAPGKTAAASRAPSVVSKSGWTDVSKGPW